jgi:hypothetical protein
MEILDWLPSQKNEEKFMSVGKITEITKEGRPRVDYPGNKLGPIEARSIIELPATLLDGRLDDIPVLLLFEGGDPSLPIIVGIIRDTVASPDRQAAISSPTGPMRDVSLDGKKLLFEAQEEIVLRCGKGTMTLRKDGKILVKGTEIVSRASGANKIKGASVLIN